MHLLLRPAALYFLLLLGACTPHGSGAARGAAAPPQLLRMEARDFTFAAPASVPAGLTRVRLVNRGGAWHEAAISRLPEGTSTEAYRAAAVAGESFPVGATDLGGPGIVAAGDSSEVVLRLPPGRYAIVCWVDGHVKSGMVVPLTVVPAGGARGDSAVMPFVADGDVALLDFRFAHAAPFRGGHQLLHVRNEGQRPHDMSVYRLDPGKTLRDFGAWYRSRQGTPPAVPVGGTSTVAPGGELWVALTLPAGRYFVACGTPEGNQIHAQLGMIEEFEVQQGPPRGAAVGGRRGGANSSGGRRSARAPAGRANFSRRNAR